MAPSAASVPEPAVRKKAHPPKLELVVGPHVVECHDGDIIGREGTIAPHLLKDAAGMQPRHILIGKGPEAWFVMVPRNIEVVTYLDDAVLAPGVRRDLSSEHRLQVADFAFSLRLSEAAPSSINDSFFSRLMKMLNLG